MQIDLKLTGFCVSSSISVDSGVLWRARTVFCVLTRRSADSRIANHSRSSWFPVFPTFSLNSWNSWRSWRRSVTRRSRKPALSWWSGRSFSSRNANLSDGIFAWLSFDSWSSSSTWSTLVTTRSRWSGESGLRRVSRITRQSRNPLWSSGSRTSGVSWGTLWADYTTRNFLIISSQRDSIGARSTI